MPMSNNSASVRRSTRPRLTVQEMEIRRLYSDNMTWEAKINEAKYDKVPRVVTTETVCCICLTECDNSNKTWMVCAVCNRPVTHTRCMRKYIVNGDYGIKKCPNCNTHPLHQHAGQQTLFPLNWGCTRVSRLYNLSSSDTE